MGDMIEKVAEAICQADEQNGGPSWGYVKSLGKHAVNGYHDRARAAIEALRKPTPEMLRACWPNHHPWGKDAPPPEDRPNAFEAMQEKATTDWQTMIDTALAETKTQ